MPKVFISHSSADSDFVEREIIAPLHQAGIATWYSKEDIRPKDIWEPRIRTALKECDWFLLAMSPRAAQSAWVLSELRWAMKHRFGQIVPVLIEECDPYDFHLHLEGIHHIDFCREQERVQAKKNLIRTFPAPVAPPPAAPKPATSAPPPPAPAKEWVSPFSRMKFVLIPAGSFEMGSPEDDKDARSDEKPRHRVTISRPFYLGVYEVTQGEYQRVMGENPSYFEGSDSLPVETVSWFDAVKFCNALSAKEGLTPFYKIVGDDQVTVPDWNGTGYRLPTEAEWEYACRACRDCGVEGATRFGDDAAPLRSFGWFADNSGRDSWDADQFWRESGTDASKYVEEVRRHGCVPHPVGEKLPNKWGLYDMHGNVWEWCWDWYDKDYYKNVSSNIDPKGSESGDARVLRGGSWRNVATRLRSAFRDWNAPAVRHDYVGLRCMRTYP